MDKKKLGNSDLYLSPIGFGAWAIGGGDWAFAWGPQDDNDSIAAIHKALDLGVNWIDTAAVYGLGHSEEVVSRALKTASKNPTSSPSPPWSGTTRKKSPTPKNKYAASAKTLSVASTSKQSISIRSTGPSPTKI
jgi:hypothetical protein